MRILQSKFLFGPAILFAVFLCSPASTSQDMPEFVRRHLQEQATLFGLQSKAAPKAPKAFVRGEVVVKLKEHGKWGDLIEEKYSKRKLRHEQTFSKLRTRYAKYKIRKERPVFKDLHATLKRKNANLREFNETIKPRKKRTQPKTETRDLVPIYVLKTEEDVLKVAAELMKDPDIEYVQPNYLYKASVVGYVPNDPYYHSSGSWGQNYDDLWGLKKIQAEQAWNKSLGQGVTVAVVDTGLDFTHPDIQGNIWGNEDETPNDGIDNDQNGYVDDVKGWDFTTCQEYDLYTTGDCLVPKPEDNDPADENGHGTHCSGTIAAVANDIGIIGVAPQARIMAVRGLNSQGAGSDESLAQAIYYAANNGADIISNSWGSSARQLHSIVEDAVNYAHDVMGCVVVAAAGNDGSDVSGFFPADINNAITVSASGHLDKRSPYSNWGVKIDVAAPGGADLDILSLLAQNSTLGNAYDFLRVGSEYLRIQGTSMACPHVSGLAALILSRHPDFSPEEVRQTIRISADDLYEIDLPGSQVGWDVYTGYGRINAFKALEIESALEAKIEEPFNSFHNTEAEYLEVKGIASGDGFKNFRLEWGKDIYPDEWVLIKESATPVANNGVLGLWNIAGLPTDRYILKLSAQDNQGNVFTDRALAFIEGMRLVRITEDASISDSPSISGDKIVWQDYRNGNWDIYMYDLAAQTETQLTDDPEDQWDPHIDGDKIVWTDRRNGNDDIYMYDLTTRTEMPITDDPAEQFSPSISGKRIVWQDRRNDTGDIYMYDIDTQTQTQLTNSPRIQGASAISGDNIVWMEFQYSTAKNEFYYLLYLYNIKFDRLTQITSDPGRYSSPKISGNIIAWIDWGADYYSSDVFLYNIIDGKIKKIAEGPYDGQYNILGSVDGYSISYVSNKSGIDAEYLYYISTDTTTQITNNSAYCYGADISGTRMVWRDNRNDDGDIYLAFLNPVLPSLSIGTIGDKNVKEGELLEVLVSEPSLPAQDLLSYSVEDMPQGATFVDNAFRWTPDYTQAGEYSVTFRVRSEGGWQNAETITITVEDTNCPPVIQPINNKTVNEGEHLEFRVLAQDFDEEPISFSVENLPLGATFIDHVFSWTPGFAQSGQHAVTFKVSDGHEEISKTVTITIKDVNRPPILNPVGNKQMNEGEFSGFMLSGSDPDGDQISYFMENPASLPGGAVFEAPLFSWGPGYDQSGKYVLTFGVRDSSGLEDTETITITVNDVNRPPVFQPIGNKKASEGNAVQFNVVASDPDGDPISFSAEGLPQGATFSGPSFSWTPTYSQAGDYSVKFTVSDGHTNVSETIMIQVKNTGDLAKILTPAAGTILNDTPTFTWDAGIGVTQYSLKVSYGATVIYGQELGTSRSAKVDNIPLNGQRVAVKLGSFINGTWYFSDYVYQVGKPARIITPAAGSVFYNSQTFTWDAGVGVTGYGLLVKTSGGTIYNNQSLGTSKSATVPGIPMDGNQVEATLSSFINGKWYQVTFAWNTVLGSRMIVNGDFSLYSYPNIPGWSVNGMWYYDSSGKQVYISVNPSNLQTVAQAAYPSPALAIKVGTSYQVEFDARAYGGTFIPAGTYFTLGGKPPILITQATHYKVIIAATTTGNLQFVVPANMLPRLAIDNVSVKEYRAPTPTPSPSPSPSPTASPNTAN